MAFLITVSFVIFSLAGTAVTLVSGADFGNLWSKPAFSGLLALGENSNNSGGSGEENLYEFETEEEMEIPELTTAEAETNSKGQEETTTEAPTYVTDFEEQETVTEDSPYYDDPGLVALTTDYPYTTVEDNYFDDALFIGDSRIEGMKLYSGLSKATFYSKEGTTIYKILSEQIATAKIDGKQTTVSVQKGLKYNSFGKIYIMLGINELGYKTTEDFAEKYAEVVDKVHRLQPEATIYLLSVMKVTNDYQKDNDVYNNVNINAKNVAIARIAQEDGGRNIFYLDVNKAVEDKNNNLKKSYSWDGVHLKAEYYSLIVDYLKEHAVVKTTEEETTTEQTTTAVGTASKKTETESTSAEIESTSESDGSQKGDSKSVTTKAAETESAKKSNK